MTCRYQLLPPHVPCQHCNFVIFSSSAFSFCAYHSTFAHAFLPYSLSCLIWPSFLALFILSFSNFVVFPLSSLLITFRLKASASLMCKKRWNSALTRFGATEVTCLFSSSWCFSWSVRFDPVPVRNFESVKPCLLFHLWISMLVRLLMQISLSCHFPSIFHRHFHVLLS